MFPIVLSVNGALRKIPILPLYALAFVPAVWMIWQAVAAPGPDPVKTLEHGLGLVALQFLIASLCVTPLLRLTRINLVCWRRLLGLMAFYYVLLHFAVYLFLDLQLDWSVLAKDLTKRPYIILGTLSMLLLVPLALTSNNWAIRRMGSAAWCKLHKLVYPAAAFAAVHYVWLVKSWPLEPLAYAAVVAGLLGYRAARKFLARPRVQTAGRTA